MVSYYGLSGLKVRNIRKQLWEVQSLECRRSLARFFYIYLNFADMIHPFQFSSLPEIRFGKGKRAELPEVVSSMGHRVLLLTGSTSIHHSGHGDEIISGLKKANLELFHEIIAHEPSPALVDGIVEKHRSLDIEVVAAVGGGSVMDAGKAV